jgi:anti-anti-sigma factor
MSAEQLHEKLYQALSGAKGINLSDPAEVNAYLAGLPPNVRSVVGGNTACVEVDTGTDTIIIDCGSGIRHLGISLMAREFGRGKGTAHIFLTHAHWDHLQGYPFFTPAYVPGNKLIFYAVNHNPQKYLEHQQVAPMYFPIPPNDMPADKEFRQLHEGETVQIGRVVVSNLSLSHPGIAYAYRFDDGESVFVFASDAEYKSLNEASLKRYITFFADADALVFDSQYSLRDLFISKTDWGHSSAIIGVDIAERARVKRLITFHHDPTYSDEQIYAIATAAREYAVVNQIRPNTQVIVGTEGLELFLGQPPGLEALEERSDTIWTLALAGQLNASTAPEAQERLGHMLRRAPAGRVILDLTLLATLDAIGIKALLDAARASTTAQLAVLAPTPSVRRLLDQSSVGEVLRIFHNRQQALTALTGPAHLRLTAATIGGHYQIAELLFVDEAGVVYRGLDRNASAPVSVRVVAGQASDPLRSEATARAEAWRALLHPSLLALKAVIADEAWVAFVSPRPEAASLRDWRAGRPMWLDVWRTAEQLCEALAVMHTSGVTHGDLRPENIMLNGTRAMVARAPLFPHPPEYGPAAYRAPELLPNSTATQRADVYALGIVLYELFLGAYPFAADSEDLRLTLQLYSQPQSPRVRWLDIPEALENLLMKMLALEPNERYASGQDVLAAYAAITPKPGPDSAGP